MKFLQETVICHNHIIRRTDIPELRSKWVTNTPSVKIV